MIPFFPKQISTKAIVIYLLSLAVVSFLFLKHMLKLDFLIIGIVWVVLFFVLSSRYTKRWAEYDSKKFVKKLFITALILRLIWVIFSYFFYLIKTGIPFEFGASDSLGYHDLAVWFEDLGWSSIFDRLSRFSVGDRGYPLYLTVLYKIYGPNVFITRVLKSILGVFTCILIYNLTKRTINEEVGRMASIFCCLAPNLIMYCGMHVKETEMIFLTVAALERADSLLRDKKIIVWKVLLTVALVLSLFTFRSVLGSTVIFAIATMLVFSTNATIGRGRRAVLIIWGLLALGVFASGTIAAEAQHLWDTRSENQAAKRSWQEYKGMKWAKYATGTVMAPMMFVLPFPTLVDVDMQYNQQLFNGGNYVRNFLGGFVIIAVFGAIFVKKNWRDMSLIGAFAVSYLGVISSSGFANSERFLLPGLPFLLIMAAYGVYILDGRSFRFLRIWYFVVPVMAIGWAVFKLGTRGIL